MMNINKFWLFATVVGCAGPSAFCSHEQVEKEVAGGSPSQSMTNCEDDSKSKNSIVLKETGRALMRQFANSQKVKPEDALDYYKAGIEEYWTTWPKGSSFDKQRKRSIVEDLRNMSEELPAKMMRIFEKMTNSGKYSDEVVKGVPDLQARSGIFCEAIQKLAPIYGQKLAKLEDQWQPLDEFYKARQSALESYHSDRPLAQTLCEFVQEAQITLPVLSGKSKDQINGLCCTINVQCLEQQIDTMIHHFQEKLGDGDESISLALEKVIDLLQDTRVEPWMTFSNRMDSLKEFLSSNEGGLYFFRLSRDEKLDFVADVLVDKYNEIQEKIRQEKRQRESQLPFGIQPITGNHEVDLALIASLVQGGF